MSLETPDLSLARELVEARVVLDVDPSLELCPAAAIRPTRLRRYREVASEIRAILRGTTDRLEPAGLDGTYLEAPPRADPLSLAAVPVGHGPRRPDSPPARS